MENSNTILLYAVFFSLLLHILLDQRQTGLFNYENNNNSNKDGRFDGSETFTRKHVNDSQMASIIDRRHLEDLTNHQQQQQLESQQHQSQDEPVMTFASEIKGNSNKALIIDDQLTKLDAVSILYIYYILWTQSHINVCSRHFDHLKQQSVDEMERKKEKIMLMSLQRRQQQEEAKARKEIEIMQRREKEREKEDERCRKREEQAARRNNILEQHRLKKAIEDAEQKGISIDRQDLMAMKQQYSMLASQNSGTPKMRTQKMVRPRPKTIHVESGSVDISEASSLSSRNKKGSSNNLTGKFICSEFYLDIYLEHC